jgi:hypothetical protein
MQLRWQVSPSTPILRLTTSDVGDTEVNLVAFFGPARVTDALSPSASQSKVATVTALEAADPTLTIEEAGNLKAASPAGKQRT